MKEEPTSSPRQRRWSPPKIGSRDHNLALAAARLTSIVRQDMAEPIHRIRLDVFADYFQFYVWDPISSERQAPEDWTDDDVANRAKAVPGVVVVCPVRNMTVPLEFEIWSDEPQVIFDEWQHVVIAPLRTTGTVEIHECTGGSLATFSVAPGEYVVRALFKGLNTLSEDGLDGHDLYRLQMWSSPVPATFQVIKRWE